VNVLIVVSHPDDEVLGCGATGAALAAAGRSVRACFLAGQAEARGGRPASGEFVADIEKAQRELGFGPPIQGSFPNIRLNTVPHIELVQFIENAIEESQAQVIFTHHPADLNDDHGQTARACLVASRLFQRRANVKPLRRLCFMEILSSTDWSYPAAGASFQADTFVETGAWLERKLAALRAYRGVMRPFPHPRSEEIVRGLAAYRGGQSGLQGAEAFQTVFAGSNVARDLF
jgi:LmbE family N-acetylglucosaminyl deacetylase